MRGWPFVLGAFIVLGVVSLFAPTVPAAHHGGPIDTGDAAWMLCATTLVLLMTPGLSFFYGGMVRGKSVISTMVQSFIAMGVVSVLWVVVGFSLAFGESIGGRGTGLIGNPLTFLFLRGVDGATEPDLAPTIPLALFALFQLKFAIITPALVSGSFAERVRFSSYLVFICLFTLLIYCPLAHWTWHPNGFLRTLGVLDFAGGSVVHMSSGLAALAGAMVLGRRKDHVRGRANEPGNIPFVLLGTGMLWFGWFGFNAGSALSASGTAAMAFLTTNTASAAAMLTWIMVDRVRGLKVSALGLCVGAVVGLVAITPGAGYVSVGASIFIGITASLVSNYAVHYKSRSTLDDTLDVFPCHGVGGMFGMLATGVFASAAVNPAGADGLLHGGTHLFMAHVLALFVVAAYSFGGAWVLFRVTDWLTPLRVKEEQEAVGLDISQHGEGAYM